MDNMVNLIYIFLTILVISIVIGTQIERLNSEKLSDKIKARIAVMLMFVALIIVIIFIDGNLGYTKDKMAYFNYNPYSTIIKQVFTDVLILLFLLQFYAIFRLWSKESRKEKNKKQTADKLRQDREDAENKRQKNEQEYSTQKVKLKKHINMEVLKIDPGYQKEFLEHINKEFGNDLTHEESTWTTASDIDKIVEYYMSKSDFVNGNINGVDGLNLKREQRKEQLQDIRRRRKENKDN